MSASNAAAAMPSPLLLFQSINAYQRTAALKTAIELDLFTAIAQGGDAGATVAELSQRIGAAERGVRIGADTLAVFSLLHKQDGRYTLTADTAAFLNRQSPMYIGSAVRFLLHPELTGSFTKLTEAARKGGTAMAGAGTTDPDDPLWVEFAEGMASLQHLPSESLARQLGVASAGRLKVLDIAAGHGMFGIAVARHNPQAEITAVDWKSVLAVAQRNAREAGVESRYRTIAGSAFDVDFGSGYDIVLLTNFLHHFDVPTCESFLKKIHGALKPGGRAATVEFVPNEDRVSPSEAATFSLIMLATTPGGDAYTFAEFDRMFRNAGFARSEVHSMAPAFSTLLISHR